MSTHTQQPYGILSDCTVSEQNFSTITFIEEQYRQDPVKHIGIKVSNSRKHHLNSQLPLTVKKIESTFYHTKTTAGYYISDGSGEQMLSVLKVESNGRGNVEVPWAIPLSKFLG